MNDSHANHRMITFALKRYRRFLRLGSLFEHGRYTPQISPVAFDRGL
jgi:hypothetical protein